MCSDVQEDGNAALWLDGLLVEKNICSELDIFSHHGTWSDNVYPRISCMTYGCYQNKSVKMEKFVWVRLCIASPDCSPSNIHPESKWLHLFDHELVNSRPTSQPGFKGRTSSPTPHK